MVSLLAGGDEEEILLLQYNVHAKNSLYNLLFGNTQFGGDYEPLISFNSF